TFFVIGNKVNLYQDTLRTMVKNGNEIGNHSYNHKYLTRVTDHELLQQIEDTQAVITKTTGTTPKLFRPTYGSINKHLREKVDLDIIMWTVDTSDWKSTNAKKIATKALDTIQDGDIILMHDTHSQTLKALSYMLPKLKEEGYQLVTVSELNEIRVLRESTRES
ncbi:MAG: polysaccharide deacetylase family protein, partial [Bacilli bacterium]|nr:polysaccharide deacetylase family protein [Bacilli bacterium]